MSTQDLSAVNRAFSKQSVHFDEDDLHNKVLQDLRADVYNYIRNLLHKHSRILELNAGTGIDAEWFVKEGHEVYATDLSDGMIARLKEREQKLSPALHVRQLSFEQLDQLNEGGFDLVFSNFGGLNCTARLDNIAKSVATKMKTGGFLVWVIMPPVSLWEMLGILKGNRHAFRRMSKNGVPAKLEGETFTTWYHSLRSISRAVPADLEFVSSSGLAAVSPPPYRDDIARNKTSLYRMLRSLDQKVRHTFPFNRWADHLIVTFRKK